MMQITVKRNDFGIFSISAQGHTGYAEQGSDIVCAAVSTLMQALQVGLQDVLGMEDLEIEADSSVPRMYFIWNSEDGDGQIVAETICRSLEAVASSYPRYVTVTEEAI